MLEDGREGYLYGDALDEKALANAILRVLQSPDGGTAMGQAARARARGPTTPPATPMI